VIPRGEVVQKRDKRTRKKKWEQLEDEVQYTADQLDRAVVSKDQIRTVIRTFKEKVKTDIFPGRNHVPKTLIYAKDDAHAEEIVQIVREEFDEGNDFAVKITYKTEGEKPENLIRQFRNDFYPRIAVTVDMIATGTDIKPLEIVFFMRSVKSRNYFEQMKGRGVRVMRNDDFKAVTPDAMAKERFVIVDAVGVTEVEELNDTKPLEQNPNISFEKLLKSVRYGKLTQEKLSSLAGRLVRLEKKLTESQIKEVKKITGGQHLSDFAHDFIVAIDEDRIVDAVQKEKGETDAYVEYKPTKKELDEKAQKRMLEAIKPFIGNTQLMERLPELKAETEQIIDDVSVDQVVAAGYSPLATEKARVIVSSFKEFIEKNKNELDALQVFYGSKKKIEWRSLKDLAEKIKTPPYCLTPAIVWQAYKQLEAQKVHGQSKNKIADFVSLLKFELGKENELEPFADTIDKRFARWLSEQRAMNVEFSQEQLNWLEKIKEHIAESVELSFEDFEDVPFNQMGGFGKARKVFGSKFDEIIEQLTVELVG
jgi:type I restriction enzyme R subunit